MKKKILATFAISLFMMSMVGIANAAIIGSETPIPDNYVLLNYNNTGLDWVYAGPIATGEFGPGQIEDPSFRAGEGWRFATQAEWAIRPDWTDFNQPGYSVPAEAGWDDHSQYKFASEYWGNFYHVDLNDAAQGYITNGLDIGSLTGVWETWYVRDSSANPVPIPAAVWLLGSGLLGLVGVRRKIRK